MRGGVVSLWDREEDDGRLWDDEPEDESAICEVCDVCHCLAPIVRLDLHGFRHCVEHEHTPVACDLGCGRDATHFAEMGELRLCDNCDTCAVCGKPAEGGLCPTHARLPQAWEAGDAA